jgi:predicted Zn-dependent protease
MRTTFIRLLAVTVFACFATASLQAVAQNGVGDETVREAYALVQQKRAKEALAKLAPLAPEYAGDADFHTVRGIALLESGRPSEAAASLRRALTIRPDHAVARIQLGRALAKAGALTDARREVAIVRERPDLGPDMRRVMDQNLIAIEQTGSAASRRPVRRLAGSPMRPRPWGCVRPSS